jgi:hypothetical protein|nr:MAG TPA: hypothetical protein [Caudoviricetes sp.]
MFTIGSLYEGKIYKNISGDKVFAAHKKGFIVRYLEGEIKNGKVKYSIDGYLDPPLPGDIADDSCFRGYYECNLNDLDKVIEKELA